MTQSKHTQSQQDKILSDAWCDMARKNEELQSRIAELEKDAARYRWLREKTWFDKEMCVVKNPAKAVKIGHECPFTELLDEAIDTAMQKD